MPVLDRLLQETDLTAEELGRLRKAYELALAEISVKDRDDPLAETIATGIVEAGQTNLSRTSTSVTNRRDFLRKKFAAGP